MRQPYSLPEKGLVSVKPEGGSFKSTLAKIGRPVKGLLNTFLSGFGEELGRTARSGLTDAAMSALQGAPVGETLQSTAKSIPSATNKAAQRAITNKLSGVSGTTNKPPAPPAPTKAPAKATKAPAKATKAPAKATVIPSSGPGPDLNIVGSGSKKKSADKKPARKVPVVGQSKQSGSKQSGKAVFLPHVSGTAKTTGGKTTGGKTKKIPLTEPMKRAPGDDIPSIETVTKSLSKRKLPTY